MSDRAEPLIAASAPSGVAIDRFRADLARLCDPDTTRLLVAVSGGTDSLALLLLAHAVLGDRCLAATVDHGLRPASANEARFVAYVCAERRIEHAILSGPMPGKVGRTANVSARARALRYQLLADHAAGVGATAVATAHHADDQLETLVMRLNRGAGVAGLAGIRARSGEVIRPLLGWRRDELAAVVAASGVDPVDDPSNRDDRYDRARLRKALAGTRLLDADAAAHSAAALGEAEDALAWAARDLATRRCVFEEASARLTNSSDLPAELRRRLVERCILHLDPSATPRGPAITRLLESLARGERAMLGAVLCEAESTAGSGAIWHFRRAPPRRSH